MSNGTNGQPPAADQEIDSRLAVVQEAVSSLANPIPLVEEIGAGLDYLAEENADPGALDAIHRSAITLLDSQQRLAAAFASAMELARALKDQREKARQGLTELRGAIENCDTDVPEIESLVEMLREEDDEMLWYTLNDMIADRLVSNTPLDYYADGMNLLAILEGGELDHDHYLWDELRDWIRRAQATIETGITPEPGI